MYEIWFLGTSNPVAVHEPASGFHCLESMSFPALICTRFCIFPLPSWDPNAHFCFVHHAQEARGVDRGFKQHHGGNIMELLSKRHKGQGQGHQEATPMAEGCGAGRTFSCLFQADLSTQAPPRNPITNARAQAGSGSTHPVWLSPELGGGHRALATHMGENVSSSPNFHPPLPLNGCVTLGKGLYSRTSVSLAPI